MRRRKQKEDVVEARLKKELLIAVFGFIVRFVGEAVKDKFARAVLLGIIGVAGIYYDATPPELEQTPIVSPAPAKVIQEAIK